MTIPNDKTVDIIIPVFNAIEYVKRCVQSVIDITEGVRYSIIIVNDGSDENTANELRKIALDNQQVTLINNKNNEGYTRAVNRGMKHSSGDYIVLLNSDTEVSPNWLIGLISCVESDAELGIVGPLSNAASWQTVPELVDSEGQFKVNSLPQGFSVADVAVVIGNCSIKLYPKVPFVNGFCFLVTRKVVDAIGYMDELNFPRGYGEENDYCLRASQAGFKLAIADDVYVYHAKSKSFGHETRKELSSQGARALKNKHGEEWVKEKIESIRDVKALQATRQLVSQALSIEKNKHKCSNPKNVEELNVLFLLPKPGIGGGSHSVVQEVTAMRNMGVNAVVAVKEQYLPILYERYDEIEQVEQVFIGFNDVSLLGIAKYYDIVIATIFHTTNEVKSITDAYPHILPAYYVQDYEPYFFDEKNDLWKDAYDSYQRLSDALLFAKTFWIAREVAKHHGVGVRKVVPSIDHQVYYPSDDSSESENIVHIAAMVRPRTPRRGAVRTMQLMSNIKHTWGDNVEIHLFGFEHDEDEAQALVNDFDYKHYGIMDRTGVADLLRKMDVFVDLSDYQAFGRTSLEAMACGCTALLPKYGGGDEYAIDGINAFVVDTFDIKECSEKLGDLIQDAEKLQRMKFEALRTSAHYSPEKAARSELQHIYDYLNVHRQRFPYRDVPSLCILNTGESSHHVLLNSKQVNAHWFVRVVDSLPNPVEAKLLIISSDQSLLIPYDVLTDWLYNWRESGNKLVFEVAGQLSYNSNSKKDWLLKACDAVFYTNQSEIHPNDNVDEIPTWSVGTDIEYVNCLNTVHQSAPKQTMPYGKELSELGMIEVKEKLAIERKKWMIRDKRARQWRKLKQRPHQYFADSKIQLLRPLRFLFPRKRS